MRPVRFAIATEQHARQFGALMKATGWYEAYIERSTPRMNAINAEFLRLGIKDRVKRLDFHTCLDGDREEVLVLPLYISRARQHVRYRSMPGFLRYLDTDLDKMHRRTVLMNEDFYYSKPDYYPHVHLLLARSPLEYELLQTRCGSPNTTACLLGDPALDCGGYNPTFRDRKARMGIFTAADTGIRKKHALAVVNTIIGDLETAFDELGLRELIHKPHPGEKDGPHWDRLETFAKARGVKFVREKGTRELGAFYNLDAACIQDSWTTNTHLRKNGVRTYYYLTDEVVGWELNFMRSAGHPRCRVIDDPGEAYDKWVRETFILDGKTGERFEACMSELR